MSDNRQFTIEFYYHPHLTREICYLIFMLCLKSLDEPALFKINKHDNIINLLKDKLPPEVFNNNRCCFEPKIFSYFNEIEIKNASICFTKAPYNGYPPIKLESFNKSRKDVEYKFTKRVGKYDKIYRNTKLNMINSNACLGLALYFIAKRAKAESSSKPERSEILEKYISSLRGGLHRGTECDLYMMSTDEPGIAGLFHHLHIYKRIYCNSKKICENLDIVIMDEVLRKEPSSRLYILIFTLKHAIALTAGLKGNNLKFVLYDPDTQYSIKSEKYAEFYLDAHIDKDSYELDKLEQIMNKVIYYTTIIGESPQQISMVVFRNNLSFATLIEQDIVEYQSQGIWELTEQNLLENFMLAVVNKDFDLIKAIIDNKGVDPHQQYKGEPIKHWVKVYNNPKSKVCQLFDEYIKAYECNLVL